MILRAGRLHMSVIHAPPRRGIVDEPCGHPHSSTGGPTPPPHPRSLLFPLFRDCGPQSAVSVVQVPLLHPSGMTLYFSLSEAPSPLTLSPRTQANDGDDDNDVIYTLKGMQASVPESPRIRHRNSLSRQCQCPLRGARMAIHPDDHLIASAYPNSIHTPFQKMIPGRRKWWQIISL
jgi:hypothetical protein